MAKEQKQQALPVHNFRDIDNEAVSRAATALSGFQPLKVPAGTKASVDKKGIQRWRWAERGTIVEASRSTTKNGLLEVTVALKLRQSKDNAGARVYGRFYINTSAEVPKNHEFMNDKSNAAILSLLVVTGYVAPGGTVKGSILDKMFPAKGQPGTVSPLNNKAVIANIVQELSPVKDENKKVKLDDEGEPILQRKDNIESFLPETVAAVAADEDDDDEVDEDETDDTDGDDEDEDEEEAPAPVVAPAKRRK